MRKAILNLFVLLIALGIHSFGQIPQWKVVKEFHRIGATNPISQTTIFTPESIGLYRVSVNLAGFTTVTENTGWNAIVLWTDATSNPQGIAALVRFSSGSNSVAQGPQTFSSQPGIPVVFGVEATTPPPTNSHYDVVFTIEKLTN